MVSKMKFKDWTCDGCQQLQREGQTVQAISAASRSVQTEKSGAPSSSAAAKTSNTKQRGCHTCTECHQLRRTEDFNLLDCRHIPRSRRCKDCEFPDCHNCGVNYSTAQRQEDRTAVHQKQKNVLPDGTRLWFCERSQCQAAKKEDPIGGKDCTVCGMKMPRAAFEKKTSGNLKDVCPSCEFPTCQNCSKKCDKVRPLRRDSNQRWHGTWYCSNSACSKALQDIRKVNKK